jgi:hypothetical protein
MHPRARKPAQPSVPAHATWARAGTTLIEVVLAALLLSIVVVMIVATVSNVTLADLRGRQRLEALELANRLLLQYLDDKDKMPSQSAHIVQGMGVYRWTLRETPVAMDFPRESVFTPREGNSSVRVLEQTNLLTVTVWTGVPDGLGGYAPGAELATLARVHNPMSAITRNPDVLLRATSNPDQLLRVLLQMVEQGRGSVSGGAGGAGSSGRSSPQLTPGRGSPFGGATGTRRERRSTTDRRDSQQRDR